MFKHRAVVRHSGGFQLLFGVCVCVYTRAGVRMEGRVLGVCPSAFSRCRGGKNVPSTPLLSCWLRPRSERDGSQGEKQSTDTVQRPSGRRHPHQKSHRTAAQNSHFESASSTKKDPVVEE